VREFFTTAVCGYGDSELDRSVGGAARQARAVLLCAVRTVQIGPGHMGRSARGVWRQRDRDAQRIHTEFEEDHYRAARADAARPGAGVRADAGEYLSRRAFAEQLFFLRPVPGWAYYKTPIDGLYMCGSATHPGGGIMAAPGRIASQVILKEWKGASSSKNSSRAATPAQAGN